MHDHHRDTVIFSLSFRVHRLVVALPEPGEYMHEVILMKQLPGALTCMLPDKTKLSLNLQDQFLALRVKVHTLSHAEHRAVARII
jgi:hypothetical protein